MTDLRDIKVIRERDLTQFSDSEMDLDKLFIKADQSDLALTDAQKFFTGTQLKNAIKGFRTQVVLTSAEILALKTTHKKIIDAAGLGKMIIIDKYYARCVNGTTDYVQQAANSVKALVIGNDNSGSLVDMLTVHQYIDSDLFTGVPLYSPMQSIYFPTTQYCGLIATPNTDIYVGLFGDDNLELITGDYDCVIQVDYHIEDISDYTYTAP